MVLKPKLGSPGVILSSSALLLILSIDKETGVSSRTSIIKLKGMIPHLKKSLCI
jgi:hypothetical protein